VEDLVTMVHPYSDTYVGKRVFVTGHTGFKGAWLCEWLLALGAEVHGFALPPEPHQRLFIQLGLEHRMGHKIGDVRDAAAVTRSLRTAQPDFVFHLAAQPLVRASYQAPVQTYATNVLGTLHVLEALRLVEKACCAVFVTTDKCYENQETGKAFDESDPLGGSDPYSSSKACAEIAIHSWRRSFFRTSMTRIGSARAGNVIGGGDWSPDRILPDSIRALQEGRPVPVRNPDSVRPWEHVLEPLGGYLLLGAKLARQGAGDESLCSAFNFGPEPEANRTVRQLVEEVLRNWPGEWADQSSATALHEAKLLHLSTGKARRLLRWQPVWNFADTVARTVEWYRDSHSGGEARELCGAQIRHYANDATKHGFGCIQEAKR
jgi:CDP-glucose 4,6-dehydratase